MVESGGVTPCRDSTPGTGSVRLRGCRPDGLTDEPCPHAAPVVRQDARHGFEAPLGGRSEHGAGLDRRSRCRRGLDAVELSVPENRDLPVEVINDVFPKVRYEIVEMRGRLEKRIVYLSTVTEELRGMAASIAEVKGRI